MALLSSACRSVVEKGLTPPTLSETPDNVIYRTAAFPTQKKKPPNISGGVKQALPRVLLNYNNMKPS
jgi:hypothetical protein